MRATILSHRDIVPISLGRVPLGPNALRYSERVLAIMRAGGVPDQVAVLGHHLLIAVVNGFTLDETPDLQATDSEPSPPENPNMVRDYVAALPRDRFPNLVALADYFANGDPDENFELLLDLFVEGLTKRANA
jgi:hypothetical protein